MPGRARPIQASGPAEAGPHSKRLSGPDPAIPDPRSPNPCSRSRVTGTPARWWLAAAVGAYALNVVAYSLWLKHVAMIDVMSLASGFVRRVLGGCAAAAVPPRTWLLKCIFFLAMFIAFGKRLGERRTLGETMGAARVGR